MQSINRVKLHLKKSAASRAGSIIVMAAAVMIVIFAFTSFTVDVGFIALTKGQLQTAADGAALAAGMELARQWGAGAEGVDVVTADARQAAVAVAAANRAGERDSVFVNADRDIRFGRREWDDATEQWTETWDAPPYNLVKVQCRRNVNPLPDPITGKPAGASGDAPLPLFFGPVIGHDTASLGVSAVATLAPGVGFRIEADSSQTVDVLPIALDLPTWEALINDGVGTDQYRYHPETGAVTPGQDGILEVDLYPYGNTALPPGNRGTVDLGNPNNSTNDLKRQILHGLNAYDLSFFGGELRFDQGPLYLNGDTGISAGIKAELEAIKGQPRAIPIFTEVSGPGNNATYTIVKFVGIRIMNVKLTGGNKAVVVQPAPFHSSTLIRGKGVVTETDTLIAPVVLLR